MRLGVSLRRFVLITGGLLLLGAVVLPLLAYFTGTLIIGPFEDERGLPRYIASIYADAARGHLAPIIFLLSPLLAAFVLWAAVRLTRLAGRAG